MKWKKGIAYILTVAVLSAMLPTVAGAEDGLELMGMTEVLYSSSTINKFHLQNKEFSLNDSSISNSDYASLSIGANVKEARSSSLVEMLWSDSKYPLGKSYYRCSKSGSDRGGWYQWARWVMTGEEAKLMKKLLYVDGNLQVGGRYQGHIDSQSGTVMGQPQFAIEQNYVEGSDATVLVYKDHTMSKDSSKDTPIQQTLAFSNVDQKTNAIYMKMSGTKAPWLFWDDKNFAEIYYPQAFFRDVLAPKVEKVYVEGGTKSSSSGTQNFSNGDKVQIRMELTEPVRMKNGDYNNAFKITASGLSDFKAVKYDEVNYEKAQLTYEATVVDSPDCRSFSDFVVSVAVQKDRVFDLAGNAMGESPATTKHTNIRLDGYLPRIDGIDVVSVSVKNAEGKFITTKEHKPVIKPGDMIKFRVHFNQYLKETCNSMSVFPISVDGSIHNANMSAVYKDGRMVSKSGNYIEDSMEFDAVEYDFTVPASAKHGAVICTPDKHANGYWEITDFSDSLSGMYGNLRLDVNRKNLQKRTEMKAQDGEDHVFALTVDTESPTLSLTDDKGNAAENVFLSAGEAANVTGEKKNQFKVYVKSDETVMGSVKAELKYVSKETPVTPVVLSTQSTGAYTGSNVLSDMYLDFSVPQNVEIDSIEHDIYIETTAYDDMYNKSVQKFYLAADTKKPKTTVTNGGGKGELVDSGNVRYWEYHFEIDEAMSRENMRLYYRFGGETEYRYTDESSGFTVKSGEITAEETDSGSITYYAEDGSGNAESAVTKHYYISDNRKVEPANPEEVGQYAESRDIEFTGFLPPSEESVGIVYDYLVYSVNNGAYQAIRSEDGGNVFIPKEALSDGCIISYKLIRNTEQDMDTEAYAEVFDIVYHADDVPPDFHTDVYRDSSGNAVSARVLSPGSMTSHPRNIVSAKMVLSDGVNELELDTAEHIKNGMFYMNMDLTAIINDAENPFTSGRYTLTATVVDANGHEAVLNVLGEEGADIIVDAPVMKNIHIKSAHDTAFDENIGSFAKGENAQSEIVITQESVDEMISSGLPFTPKADSYRVETQLYMAYSGAAYPKLEEEDVYYTISADYGETWTEYAKAELLNSDAQILEEDGKSYAVYTAGVILPKQKVDGDRTFYIRFRVGANVYPGDIATVTVHTDVTAPRNGFIPDAVGSNETGWLRPVHYTKEHVRYAYVGMDDGFMGPVLTHEVLKIEDKDGKQVPKEQYGDYIEVQHVGNVLKYVIFKQRCHLYVRVSDMWGNSMDADYECMYIDDLLPEVRIYNKDTDEFTYVAVANVRRVSFGVVSPGELTMTENAKKLYEQLVSDGIVDEGFLGERPAQIEGKILAVYRFRQRKLAEQAYDIIGTTYDPEGDEIETFKVQSVASEAEPIAKLSESSTASNLGKTIRAAHTMTFNVPVAQVRGERAELLKEHGLDAAQELYTGDLMFATELNAILDITTGGTVYVVDRLGRAAEISVDVSGTEFVEYAGHSISYEEINQTGSVKRNEDFIYGDNMAVRITVSGNDDVAVVKPEISGVFGVSASSQEDTTGTEYEGYYKNLVIEAPTGFADREGTVIAARLKVKHKATLEEYNDVILLNCDDKAPVLLDAAVMKRTDQYASVNVIYIFYDRYGVPLIESDIGNGFEEVISEQGTALVRYLANGTPLIRATDGNGNVLTASGHSIDGIVISNSLVEGRDYRIEISDTYKHPVEAGKFYQAVYVKVVPIENGKTFTGTATEGVYVDSEEEIVLELVDEHGQKVLKKCAPPVDCTPPKMFAVQDNSGEYVSSIRYTVTVSDKRAGIRRVYAKGVGENGADVDLELISSDSMYQQYAYHAESADDITVVAEDGAGNKAETVLSSNSQIVGPLVLQTSQSILGATNKNVMVTISSADGRRIYTHVPENQGDSFLAPGDYVVSGNDIVFTKNGSLLVECSDEAGNRENRIITITNIDKSVPVITPVVSELEDEDGNVRTDAVKIRFIPEEADDRYMEIYLLHTERKPEEGNEIDVAKLKEKWNEYRKNPEKYVNTAEYEAVFQKLYQLDIKNETTYATVTENGEHTFYLIDKAGNLAIVPVTVTTVDETKADITGVAYSFHASPKSEETKTVSGNVADISSVKISKETTGYLTNQSIDITVTTNEPVRFYGSSDDEYKTTVTKSFFKNGIYNFAVEDKAGNVTEKSIAIENILSRQLYMEFETDEVVIFRGKEAEFDKSILSVFTVFTYDAEGNKITLPKEDYHGIIDYGNLNIEDLSKNIFNRSNPYTVTYLAIDEAGNRVERTRRVVLADTTDTLVTVNGEAPNGASCVYVDKGEVTVKVENYGGLPAVVKVSPGQKNGAQMKFETGELAQNAEGTYTFAPENTGWYTVGVRTLFQDIFVVWVYVG